MLLNITCLASNLISSVVDARSARTWRSNSGPVIRGMIAALGSIHSYVTIFTVCCETPCIALRSFFPPVTTAKATLPDATSLREESQGYHISLSKPKSSGFLLCSKSAFHFTMLNSPFKRLSAELRDRIYYLALAPDGTIVLRMKERDYEARRSKKSCKNIC